MAPAQTPDARPLLVSVREARRILGDIGNSTFWRLVQRGEIELVGTERKRWVVVTSLEQLVDRQRAKAREERVSRSIAVDA